MTYPTTWTFSQWLAEQSARNDPTGDLARDAHSDPAWPATASDLVTITAYLARVGSCSDSRRALSDAWGEWERSL